MSTKACSITQLAALFITGCFLTAVPQIALAQRTFPKNPIIMAELSLPYTDAYGIIRQPKEAHYYVFNAEAGREVTMMLLISSADSALVPVLALFDQAGNLIAYNYKEYSLITGKYTNDPILYIKIPATGIYYLGVMSAAYFRNDLDQQGETGSYRLYLLTNLDTSFPGDPNEPNDRKQNATVISPPFTSMRANLLYFGDVDWYRLTAKRGQRISIDVEALEYLGSEEWDIVARTRMGLFDEYGNLLVEADAGSDPDTGYTKDPAAVFDIPTDGKYYIAVTSIVDPDFSGPFKSAAFLADPYVSGAKNLIGNYQLQVRELHNTLCPQIANGSFGSASFISSIILVNSASVQATGKVELFKSDGTPFPAAKDASGASREILWYDIPPKSSRIILTDGQGVGASGYALITSTTSIGAFAVFSQFDASGTLLTEAAVPAGSFFEYFTFPAEVRGDFNTGFAVANPSWNSTATLSLKLLDTGGRLVASRSMSLDSGKQMSIFLGGNGQLFPGLADFRGSLQVISDTPVGAIALRSSSRSLTTLPPAPLNQSYEAISLQFPQVVIGNSVNAYRTTILLTNSSFFSVSGNIRFVRSDGNPMTVSIGDQTGFTHSFIIPAQGTIFLDASSAGGLQTGYAVAEASHSIGGLAIYSQFDGQNGKFQTEVGVAASPAFTDFLLYAQSENGYNTGLAVANTGSAASALNFELTPANRRDEKLQSGTVLLGSGRQQARMIAGANQIFPDFSGSGMLEVKSTSPVTAVALRITATTMTALPVIPIQ